MNSSTQKSGLSTLISGLSSSNAQSSSIFGSLLSNKEDVSANKMEQQDQSQSSKEQNNNNVQEEEEEKNCGSNKNQSILFKSIQKLPKEPQTKNPLGCNQEKPQNSDRVTGAGVLLWEKLQLTDEEYKTKLDILKEKSAQRSGYTILLFGQKEKKGKFKDQILYTDPGGKIDNNESSQTIASRELFEESCGTFLIDESHFDFKKSFRMGGSYILYNILLKTQSEKDQPIDLNNFIQNYELKNVDLFGSQNILTLNDAYGQEISIGRRCIAILRALTKSPNVYNFASNEILINKKVTLQSQQNNNQSLLSQFPWLKNTTIYESLQSI